MEKEENSTVGRNEGKSRVLSVPGRFYFEPRLSGVIGDDSKFTISRRRLLKTAQKLYQKCVEMHDQQSRGLIEKVYEAKGLVLRPFIAYENWGSRSNPIMNLEGFKVDYSRTPPHKFPDRNYYEDFNDYLKDSTDLNLSIAEDFIRFLCRLGLEWEDKKIKYSVSNKDMGGYNFGEGCVWIDDSSVVSNPSKSQIFAIRGGIADYETISFSPEDAKVKNVKKIDILFAYAAELDTEKNLLLERFCI